MKKILITICFLMCASTAFAEWGDIDCNWCPSPCTAPSPNNVYIIFSNLVLSGEVPEWWEYPVPEPLNRVMLLAEKFQTGNACFYDGIMEDEDYPYGIWHYRFTMIGEQKEVWLRYLVFDFHKGIQTLHYFRGSKTTDCVPHYDDDGEYFVKDECNDCSRFFCCNSNPNVTIPGIGYAWIVPRCGGVSDPTSPYDFNGDGVVNFKDYAQFVNWLYQADIEPDERMKLLSEFTEYWLEFVEM